jgi:hypothetical protein
MKTSPCKHCGLRFAKSGLKTHEKYCKSKKVDELDQLLEDANGSSAGDDLTPDQAMERLRKRAREAGYNNREVEDAPTWEVVVGMIRNPKPTAIEPWTKLLNALDIEALRKENNQLSQDQNRITQRREIVKGLIRAYEAANCPDDDYSDVEG